MPRAAPKEASRTATERLTAASVLRVLLGVVLLIDIVNLYRHLPLFPRAHPLLGLVLLAWMGIIVAMISGYRMAVIANLLCCGIILGGIALPQVSEGAARWIIAAYLSSIYVDSAIHKLLSPMWLRGLGLSTSAALPSLVWIGTAWMKYIPATLLRCVGWGVIAFELLFPVLYWRRSTRLPALAAGIAMHVGIAVLYPIPAFSGSMIVLYLALLLEERDGISPAFPARGRVRYALLGIWAMCIRERLFRIHDISSVDYGSGFQGGAKDCLDVGGYSEPLGLRSFSLHSLLLSGPAFRGRRGFDSLWPRQLVSRIDKRSSVGSLVETHQCRDGSDGRCWREPSGMGQILCAGRKPDRDTSTAAGGPVGRC